MSKKELAYKWRGGWEVKKGRKGEEGVEGGKVENKRDTI